MSQSIFKLSCSLFLSLLVSFTFAQKEKKPDSLKVKFYPRAFRVGTDIISLIKTQTLSRYSGYELNGDIDCGKYYLAADYGSWSRTYDSLGKNTGSYKNDGTYWRVGVDANLLMKDPDRNMFFFGFRYAQSSFNESAMIKVTDPYFGDVQKPLNNTGMKAAWGEFTTGLRVKIWKEFWMGYTARMKFAPSVKGVKELETYDIPGYGLYEKKIYWGFNYQIFWRIPFTKQKKATSGFPK